MKKNNIFKTSIFIITLFNIICFYLSLIYIFDFKNIGSKIIASIYPEITWTTKDFGTTEDARAILRDFILTDGNTLISTSNDPWIYLKKENNGFNDFFCLDVYINSMTQTDSKSYVYYIGEENYLKYVDLEDGLIRVDGYDFDKDKWNGVRLDLTGEEGIEIHVDCIVLNNTKVIYNYYKERIILILCWVSAFIILGILLFNNVRIVKLTTKNGLNVTEIFSMLITELFGMYVCSFFLFRQFNILQNLKNSIILIIFGITLIILFINKKFNIIFLIYEYCIGSVILMSILNNIPAKQYLMFYLFGPMNLINLLLFICIFYLIENAFGIRLGFLVFQIMYFIYLIANIIKLNIQGELISKLDFGLLPEILGIAKQYVRLWMIIVFLICLTLIVMLIIKYKKFLKEILKPKFSFMIIIPILFLVGFKISSHNNLWKIYGYDNKNNYLTVIDEVNASGLMLYVFQDITNEREDKKPQNYGINIVSEIEQYKSDKTVSVKPTIILILAESLFDINKIDGVEYDRDILENIRPYIIGNAITPSYGGRTAAAEYEAITGLPMAFLKDGVIPYDSYLNKANHTIGSLAMELKSAGYHTYAVHANSANYYSRDMAYRNMGIDEYISKEKFEMTNDSLISGGYSKDDVFVDEIIKILDREEQETFIMGISIEAHGPYINKYNDNSIKINSSMYTKEEIDELSNYCMAIGNFDLSMGKLLKYIEDKNQPVLLYIYGDHLPSLKINRHGNLQDKYFKYSTPLIAYSNYCDVSINEEYLSLCYIPSEILKNVGINYSAYYDYILQNETKYPIIQREFIEDINSDDLELYKNIEWDFLYGKKYLLKKNLGT